MQNLDYLKDLIKRVEASVKAVQAAKTPEEVSAQERASHPILKEMQMATPRVWDDYIKVTRTRRQEITEGK